MPKEGIIGGQISFLFNWSTTSKENLKGTLGNFFLIYPQALG